MLNFDEYKKLGEPGKTEKAAIWETAIGLQQVDGLSPSSFLIETARNHIDGDITISEVKERLENYYNLKNREMQVKIGTVNAVVGTVNDTVFDLIKSNNAITAAEISKQLGISLRTVKRKIKELKDSGDIERVGSDKTGRWKVLMHK